MSLQKLTLAINNLDNQIANYKISHPKISKNTIAWHIDHSLKVINNVCATTHTSDPTTYNDNFNLLGKVFFTLGFFPRGKAKAPKHVLPPETITKQDLVQQIILAQSNIAKLNNLDKNAYFIHPLFGNINTKRIPKFLAMHTNHHIKIINDILKQQKTLSK